MISGQSPAQMTEKLGYRAEESVNGLGPNLGPNAPAVGTNKPSRSHGRSGATLPIASAGLLGYGRCQLFPFRQRHDFALRACCPEVAVVGGYQYAVGSFQRDSVIIGVNEMLLELHCKLHSSL